MAPVILYDIPTKAPTKAWSLNPWKTRLVLNYKVIDYKTEWVEYPDLKTTFKDLGLPPNDKNDPEYYMDYTSPAVKFEDGTLVMNSWKIAPEIEKRYPSPSLHLDEPVNVQVRDNVEELLQTLTANVIPKIATNVLTEPSKLYFERTRAEMSGLALDRWEAERGGEKCWNEVKKPAQETAELLRKNEVSYADFIFVSFLHFLKCLGENYFERFVSLDPAFANVYDASEKWLKRDD
ncbi:glutathione S-transferase-like protein [Dendryphion nanum]|uniref:Glutathione S-transferase-like protein n=1 Tax=Dendryphion nanum TaxID=256645 RepID=A0A9P9D880_9PLEO|nr:glutathione S-transferase-like protein [Dendryphion nanum]